MKEEHWEKAKETISEILGRGNDVKIQRKKDGIVIIEEKKTIKYKTDC